MQTIETKLTTQARYVEESVYEARLASALDANEVFMIDGDRAKVLRYATPYDKKIAVLEDAIRMHRSRVGRFLASAVRLKARSERDRARLQLRCAKQIRQSILDLEDCVAKIVAERDGKVM